MSKVKLRCTVCGKWFQSANAKDTICPECAQKAKKQKQAAKAAPPIEAKPAAQKPAPPPPKPKQAQGGTNQWLDAVSDVKVALPEQPTRPKIPSPPPRDTRSGPGSIIGPTGYRDDRSHDSGGPGSFREREGNNRGPGGYRDNQNRPAPYRVGGGNGLPSEPRPRQPMDRGPRPGGEFRPDRGNRPDYRGGKPMDKPKVKTPKPPPEPKPKREKIPPPEPFVPTPEQITQVQTRYIELAQPEFDGIRTQIAQELNIPKKSVKQIVKDLRDSQHIPSWWDSQPFKGSEEDMAKIRELYEPALPLPDVGVHKKIAEQLSLKPVDVYQGIKAIRAQMNLPQYNDPALHGIELKPRERKSKQQATSEATQETAQVTTGDQTEQAEQTVSTDDISTTDTDAVAATETPTVIPENATSSTASASASEQVTPVPTDDASTTDTQAVVDASTGQEHTTSSQNGEQPDTQKPAEVEQSVSSEA